MSWVVLEVLLAFGLAVFIVWWSLPRKKKPSRDAAQRGAAVNETAGAKDETEKT
jgi:hypothetical protein